LAPALNGGVNDIRIASQVLYSRREVVWPPTIIVIEECDEVGLAKPHADVPDDADHACIPRKRIDKQPVIFWQGREAPAVIHDNNNQVLIILRQSALDRFCKQAWPAECRYYAGDGCCREKTRFEQKAFPIFRSAVSPGSPAS